MKQRISPFQFFNYRDFLRAALKEKKFSYRSFAAKHGEIASFITIASVLSRGRSGTKNKPRRNLSPETLARLGKVFRLSDEEITFLVLLKFENDYEVFPGAHGSAYMDCIRKLIRDYKSGQILSTNNSPSSRKPHSQTGRAVADLLDALPETARMKLSREIFAEATAILARQRRKAGVKTLSSIVDRLGELTKLGAP